MGDLNFMEKAISKVSPSYAMNRAIARERLTHFEAGGRNKSRGRSASLHDQASAENWKKQRKRIEAIWEGRSMEEHFCIIAGVLERLTQYVVGNLRYQANTGDADVDRAYEKFFTNWCKTCDVTGRHSFKTMVELAFRSMIRDGEHGHIILPKGKSIKLQAVEADRIGNPHEQNYSETNIGGIEINKQGAITKFNIFKRTRTSQYIKDLDVSPNRFIHLWRPVRSDQYHGVSVLQPVLKHAKDLYELLGYEKIAAKFAASFAGFVSQSDPSNSRGLAQGWDRDSGGETPTRKPNVQSVPGQVVSLDNGQSIDFAPGTQRPSGAFIALVNAIIRELSIGLNLPYGFVYDMAAFGGVTARLEVGQAERVFGRYRNILKEKLLDRVKNTVINLGIAHREVPAHPNWDKGTWQFGAHLSADIGHQTQADELLVRNGIKSRTQWARDNDYDLEENVETAAREVQMMQRVSDSYEIPMELLIQTLDQSTTMIANRERAMNGDDDEPKDLVSVHGDKGVKPLMDVLERHAEGTLDRASAVSLLVELYGMDLQKAEMILPITPEEEGAV